MPPSHHVPQEELHKVHPGDFADRGFRSPRPAIAGAASGGLSSNLSESVQRDGAYSQ